MRPVSVSLTGNGASIQNSNPIVLDFRETPFNVGLAFVTNGATTTFKVQYSLDDPYATYATDYNTNATWFDLTTPVGTVAMNALTTNTAGGLNTPVRAVRLQANATGANVASLTVVQASRP